MIVAKSIPQALKEKPRWVLWRYVKRNGKPSKVPFQVNGRFAKSDSPETWATYEDVLAKYEAGGFEGIGFVLDGSDGLIGIDLDCCLEDDGTPKPWAVEIIEALGSTYVERSPSLIGLKAFGFGSIGDRGKAWPVPGDSQGRVEVYTHGRYFTVTGDRWGDTETIEDVSEALGVISDRFELPPLPAPKATGKPANEPKGRPPAMERAMAWAAHTPGAVSGQQGHRKTFHVAQVLVNGFDLGVDAAREVLQAWNSFCNPPWSDAELEHKLEEAWKARNPATVGDMLGHREDFGQRIISLEDLDSPTSCEALQEIEPVLEFVGRARGSIQFPPRLLEVPGFVGEVSDWITSQNPRKNRILSLVAAIGLQSVLAGRKVRDKGGSRTNLYLVSIAPSGGGKQAPQTCVQKILSLSGQADLYGGKVASDSALASDLVASPSKLYLWDEFGRFLAKMHQDRGGVHVHAIQEALLELWGSTGTLWKHKSLADSKLNREVDQPCLTFVGSTVPGHFWGGLEEDHLQDGFAGRLMVIDTGPAAPTADVVETDPPESILEASRWWRNYHPGGNLDGVHPSPQIVPETPAATELFRGLVKTSESHLDNDTDAAVWSRAVEKARRLALVYAVSRDRVAPCIDDVAAHWGIDLVIWATETFLARVKDEVAPSGIMEERWRRVKRTIEGYTKHRQLCERSALLRACKWPARELDKILDSMVEAGVVTVQHVQTGRGPMSRHYSLR